MKVLRSIASGLLIILAVPATLRAQPSTDIESYALFAVDGIRAHGLVVTDGNVGVNSATGELFSAFPILAPESQLSANTVRIPLSDCKNLFGNDVVLRSCGQRAAFQSPFNGAGGVEQACDYPVPFPDCDSTGTLGGDVTVGPQEVRRLEPNQYRTVSISRGVQPGRVILTGGDYFFCNLRMGRNADLLFDSAAQVFVSGELELGGMSFTGTGGNDVGAKKIRIIHRGRTLGQESTITIPPRAHVFGQLCAPRSMLRVRYAAQLFGNFIARVIKTDRITVRSFPPCVSTCGNGIRECKEVCDGDVPCGSSATGAFTDSTGGAFVRCLDNCTRTDDSECRATTTTVTSTTTSTTGTAGTTTTTTTTPAVCGNGRRKPHLSPHQSGRGESHVPGRLRLPASGDPLLRPLLLGRRGLRRRDRLRGPEADRVPGRGRRQQGPGHLRRPPRSVRGVRQRGHRSRRSLRRRRPLREQRRRRVHQQQRRRRLHPLPRQLHAARRQRVHDDAARDLRQLHRRRRERPHRLRGPGLLRPGPEVRDEPVQGPHPPARHDEQAPPEIAPRAGGPLRREPATGGRLPPDPPLWRYQRPPVRPDARLPLHAPPRRLPRASRT